MGPYDEYILTKLAEYIKALEDHPRLRELLGSPPNVLPSYSEGRFVFNVQVNHHYHGNNVTNQQNINALAIGALAQGSNASATNSGQVFSGSADLDADDITRDQWKRDMEEIAWALAERHDDLARKLHGLFNNLASVAPSNTTLAKFQEDVLEAAKAAIPEGERPEASHRLKVVAEGMIAGTTHAVVHKFIEWLGPQLIPVVMAAAEAVHRHF